MLIDQTELLAERENTKETGPGRKNICSILTFLKLLRVAYICVASKQFNEFWTAKGGLGGQINLEKEAYN